MFFEDSPQCSDFDGERVLWPSQLTANVCVNQNNDTDQRVRLWEKSI